MIYIKTFWNAKSIGHVTVLTSKQYINKGSTKLSICRVKASRRDVNKIVQEINNPCVAIEGVTPICDKI